MNNPIIENVFIDKLDDVIYCLEKIGEEIIDYDCNSLSMSTFDNNMKEFIFETHRKHFPITGDREEKLDNIAKEIEKAIKESDATIDIDPLTGKVSKSRLEMKKKCIEQDNAIYVKTPVKFSSYENKFAGAITCNPNEMNNVEVNFKDNDIIEIKDIIHKTADAAFKAACNDYKQQAVKELSKDDKFKLDLFNACLNSIGIPSIMDINKLIKIDILHRRNNPMDDSRKLITYLIEYDLDKCSFNNIFGK